VRRTVEEDEIHGRADRVRVTRSGVGDARGGRLPQHRRVGGDVLRRKKKYANLGVSELRRLKQLEDKNSRLKRLVADLTLDKNILQEVIRKKI